MYWPQFDANTFGTMLISSILAIMVSWVTTIITNRRDREKQREAWRYEYVLPKLAEAEKQLKQMDVGYAKVSATVTVMGTSMPSEFQENHKQAREALVKEISDYQEEIKRFHKG